MILSDPQFDRASLTKSLLTHEWWTTFELASIFTGFPIRSDRVEISETSKPYLIIPSDPFDPKKCEAAFQLIFNILNEDLEYEKLSGLRCRIGKGVNFMIRRFDGLVWAMDNKLIFPIELQAALSIRFKQARKLTSWCRKARLMIFKQFCTLLRKKVLPIEIWRDSMMQCYIRMSGDERTHRQIQKDMALVSEKREPGWQADPSNLNNVVEEPLKIISAVLENQEGYCECDFILLKEVIWTAVFIIAHEVLEPAVVTRMTLPKFVQEMVGNEVIGLYVKNSPPFVVHYVKGEIAKFYGWISTFFDRW